MQDPPKQKGDIKPHYYVELADFVNANPSWIKRHIGRYCLGPRVNQIHKKGSLIKLTALKISKCYPLVNVYITMENHHAINGKNPL